MKRGKGGGMTENQKGKRREGVISLAAVVVTYN